MIAPAPKPNERFALEAELARLRTELQERKRNLPAHSIRPHQLLAIEALEGRIEALARQLEARG